MQNPFPPNPSQGHQAPGPLPNVVWGPEGIHDLGPFPIAKGGAFKGRNRLQEKLPVPENSMQSGKPLI
jgi:hypothetical protein